MGEPCGWSVTACSCSADCWTKRSPATRERAAALAAHFMWAATGRRYGLCEVTVLLCVRPDDPLYQDYATISTSTSALPDIIDGMWHNPSCTGTPCGLELPGPVDSIVEVLVDGVPVDPDAYVVYDHRTLTRTDGSCWPACSTFNEPIPSFQVTYNRGTPIPSAVQYGLEGLACQLAKACEGQAEACEGQADCALPPRMQSLTRQGITVEVAADQATSQGGRLRTGISWIDQIIEADNPAGLTRRPRVLSLDLPEPRMVTSIGGS